MSKNGFLQLLQGDEGCCDDPTTLGVDEPGEHCDGSHRQFPGQDFGDSASWAFTCPLTGEYLLVVTANCAIGYYAGEKHTSRVQSSVQMFVNAVHNNVIAVASMCEHKYTTS